MIDQLEIENQKLRKQVEELEKINKDISSNMVSMQKEDERILQLCNKRVDELRQTVHRNNKEIYTKYREYQDLMQKINDINALLSDTPIMLPYEEAYTKIRFIMREIKNETHI